MKDSGIKNLIYGVVFVVTLTLGMQYASAQSNSLKNSNDDAQIEQESQQTLNTSIDSVLAPIALYPDTLLTHILIASTYPLEVIEAARWVKKQKTNSDIVALANEQSWDPSVSALTAFPNVLNNMSDDLSWLNNLGNAFLADEKRVLDRVQALRELAYEQGNLASDDNVEIVKEKHTIVIEPRQTEYISVPYYSPQVVFGPRWVNHINYRWYDPYYSNIYDYYQVNLHYSRPINIGAALLFGGIHWSNRHLSIHTNFPVFHHRHYGAHRYNHYRRYFNEYGKQHKRVRHHEYGRWAPNRRKYNGNHNKWPKKHTVHTEKQGVRNVITSNTITGGRRVVDARLNNNQRDYNQQKQQRIARHLGHSRAEKNTRPLNILRNQSNSGIKHKKNIAYKTKTQNNRLNRVDNRVTRNKHERTRMDIINNRDNKHNTRLNIVDNRTQKTSTQGLKKAVLKRQIGQRVERSANTRQVQRVQTQRRSQLRQTSKQEAHRPQSKQRTFDSTYKANNRRRVD